MIERLPLRFMEKIALAGAGCWHWIGRVTDQGYAQVRDGHHIRAAHRVIWELLIGPIPYRHELHHRPTCARRCVNPAHLTLVSVSDHKALHRPTHCRNGHELTPENSYVPTDGNRRCRTCISERKARQKRERQERQR
jgi:hypothetical protein